MFSSLAITTPLILALTTTSVVFGLPTTTGTLDIRQTSTDDCADVHVFLARGTGEDYPGRQINVVYAICNGTGTATCDYEDIVYPASAVFPAYCTSVGDGVDGGTDQITDYASRCPDAQLVISGYSQVCTPRPRPLYFFCLEEFCRIKPLIFEVPSTDD